MEWNDTMPRPDRAQLLDDVQDRLTRRIPGLSRRRLRPLLSRWFRHVDDEDLVGRDPDVLAERLGSHLALGLQRHPGQTLVAVSPSRLAGEPTLIQVVTDDRPHVVDTLTLTLTREGWDVLAVQHPQVSAARDVSGRLIGLAESGEQALDESWVQFEARAPLGDFAERLAPGLRDQLVAGLNDLARADDDTPAMKVRLLQLVESLEGGTSSAVPPTERQSAVELLRWLADDNFTFLGSQEYRLVDGDYEAVPGTALGILGTPRTDEFHALPLPTSHELVVLTKDSRRSTVRRAALLDYVGVRLLDDKGEVIGEQRFLGLLAAGAYTESISRIPTLLHKAEDVAARSGYQVGSHGYQAIWAVLETYPRDELFHATVEELAPVVSQVSQLSERRKVRLFVRRGRWGRRISCLVYLPRDRYNTAARKRMEQVLLEATGAQSIDYQAQVSESVLARLWFTLQLAPGSATVDLDVAELEARLTEAAEHWDDRFGSRAEALGSEQRGIEFSDSYKEDFTPDQAIADLLALNEIREADEMRFALYAPDDPDDPSDLRLKVMRVGERMELSDVLPHLASLGAKVLDERPYDMELRGSEAHVYDFGLRLPGELSRWTPEARSRFVAAFEASWQGHTEVDRLNELVSRADMTWSQVQVLRAISRYLQQLGSTYSQPYIAQTIVANDELARGLVELFETRFDPASGLSSEQRNQAATEAVGALAAQLDEVASLDHDKILRQFVAVVQAIVRTNAYAADRPALAMKILPRLLDWSPQPRPAFEIWVHSPRVEGVHLRFGSVARGGLRWSDRPEDFRTEVLGLVKAQMVKNSVIVPVGAKGGFFARQLPNPAHDRAAWLAEGTDCYQLFIGSLLSLTDNIVGGQVVPPADVVRHDSDDPYLVVAADKGTASFSDVANQIAIDRGFWLGDAFASGGSVGYDHKAMGITARGAWESVKRHFREMGADCQTTDFTCVGIGDMAGDVFGNGMLLSEHTRLVAAFNHMHVFLDPDPDAARSHAERKRLFELPRSSWADYDASLISAGGGVYSRQAKSIPVTPQVRVALGLGDEVTQLAPNDLIRAILMAPVDLLWNGGIGTYVKGADETNAEVGDKANDALRVNGGQVRAKCAGEGGNLGWTQLGRIEYALAGGRINTDFIDNSAGVDTSDHEVNIKILLDAEVAAGRLTSRQRNDLLPQMTDDVATLVLGHNIDQNLALANALSLADRMAGVDESVMVGLEQDGYLDRELEKLPSSQAMRSRVLEGRGLTAPELAVLLSWTKIWLSDQVLASDLPDDPYLAERLVQYFPPLLQERYRDQMPNHRLHREIITTVAVNRFVNSQGIVACHELMAETNSEAPEVVRAQLAARSILDAGRFEVNTRRTELDAAQQTSLRVQLRVLVQRVARWLLHQASGPIDVAALIGEFHDDVQALAAVLPDLLPPRARGNYEARLGGHQAAGVEEPLASIAAGAAWSYNLPAVIAIAQGAGRDRELVARTYFQLGEQLGLDRLMSRIEGLPQGNRWEALARAAIRDDLLETQSQLAKRALAAAPDATTAEAVLAAWVAATPGLDRSVETLSNLLSDEADLARIQVGLRTVRALVSARPSSGRM